MYFQRQGASLLVAQKGLLLRLLQVLPVGQSCRAAQYWSPSISHGEKQKHSDPETTGVTNGAFARTALCQFGHCVCPCSPHQVGGDSQEWVGVEMGGAGTWWCGDAP